MLQYGNNVRLDFCTPRIRIDCSHLCAQLPTIMPLPNVQMCTRRKHAFADPRLLLHRNVASPHGNRVRFGSLYSTDTH
jgi:hypothetical protein